MKSLIQFFVRYPTMVNLGLLLTLIVGVISFSQVRYTLDPSEKPKEIYVDVIYRGASPLEIEESAITRIEENLRGITGMDRFTSAVRENSGRITVELLESADINEVLVEVENAVNRISDFPERMDRPVVYKQEMLNPTISIALTGEIPLQQKKDFARQIRDEFMIERGISNVNLFGFSNEEIVIELNDSQMDRYGLSYREVADAIQKTNIDMTGGELKLDRANWQIRARNQNKKGLEMGEILIRSGESGGRVVLKDIADIREVFDDKPVNRYLNGSESVVIQVLTTNDEDLVATAEYVKEFVGDFNSSHDGVELTIVEDISEFVNERAASLWENGLAGLILVLLILILFLDKRIAFWVSLTIPLSLLGAFIFAMMGYDLTINVVSIFGFILVLGMLVDTGVVVAENIYRHYAEFGKRPIAAARDGAAEVAAPMTISLMTTAVAFSIFFFLPGKPGAFFSEVSFVVIASLLAALIVTFLFLPAKMTHSKVLSKENRQTRFELFFTQSLITFRDRWFMPFTELASHRWRWLNVGVFLFLLIASATLLRTGTLPLTFFPYLDDDIQLIRIELEPGTPADTTNLRLMEIEKAVWQVNEDLTAERKDGQAVVRNVERLMGPNSHQGQLRVIMMGGEQRGIPAFELNDRFREAAGQIADARYVRFMGATAEQRFGGLPVDISVSGEDLNKLQQAAARLKSELEKRDDLVDVADTDQRGNPELHIELNKLGEQLGLTLQEVMAQIRNAYFGLEVQNLQRNRDDVRVWIRFDESNRTDYDNLVQMNIRTAQGIYRLGDIADIYPTSASLEVSRINGRRTIRVDADMADPSLSAPAILTDIETNVIPEIRQEYPGVQFFIEGQNREAGQVTDAMQSVAPVIIALMLALIIINFQSFSQTFIVLLSLPFAFVGVVIGHMIHGVTMNIFSVIGMIALVGILINNMLVLITAFNDNLKADMNFEEALRDAVQSRFRPILLTTLSTVAGLLPMIFMGGLASAFLQPPAIAIAYGLIFGLLISLTLTPAFLVIWNQLKLRLTHLAGKEDASPESIEPAVQLKEHHKRSTI
ncbi:efflux RND transporter permease subunit [Rhodohalobacter halophilus]|uniref:efflux RND transporter permease subunit n=1 Tax=Rhodohalobacter halophilus TaxID=1812810 RepID=UPI00083FACF7|nr:efflux RND transporter permease subunit [Rhodohalobacter halophilus]